MNEKGQGLIEPMIWPGIPIALLLVVILALLGAFASKVGPVPSSPLAVEFSLDDGGYSGLPLTEHARESHCTEKWNPVTIPEAFDQGYCRPTIYACPGEDVSYHYCTLDEEHGGGTIGLVISLTSKYIITGFQGRGNYWGNRCH